MIERDRDTQRDRDTERQSRGGVGVGGEGVDDLSMIINQSLALQSMLSKRREMAGW